MIGVEQGQNHYKKFKELKQFLQQRTRHMWCRFKKLPAECFPFFSEFNFAKYPNLHEFAKSMFLCLNECPRWFVFIIIIILSCFSANVVCVYLHSVDEYYRAKNFLLSCNMVVKCDKKAIEETQRVLDNLCAERVVERLNRFLTSPPGSPAPVVVYEILTQPEVLMNQSIFRLATRLFASHGESVKALCKKEQCLMPSLFILMTAEKPLLGFSSSILNQIDRQYSVDEFEPAYPIVKKIISALRLLLTHLPMIFSMFCDVSFHAHVYMISGYKEISSIQFWYNN